MADRVSASITIGGTLPLSLLPDLAALVQAEGLSTEWDGEPFSLAMFREGVPLELMAHEVAWGRFERVESWCITHGLPFARWSGAYPGLFAAYNAGPGRYAAHLASDRALPAETRAYLAQVSGTPSGPSQSPSQQPPPALFVVLRTSNASVTPSPSRAPDEPSDTLFAIRAPR